MKNWKTTASGIAALLAAISKAITEYATGGFAAVDFAGFATALAVGFGLLFAKDFNVTGTGK